MKNIEIWTTAAIDDDYVYCGFVSSAIVKSRNVFSQMGSGFKSLVGGELKGQTQMITDSRNAVLNMLIEQARQLGADAIYGLRIDSDTILDGFLQFVAYGTAVQYK